MTAHARPRAIVFDWDNTLVDTWPVIHEVNNLTLTHFGLEPWTLAETRQRVRKSMRDSFPALFGDRWEEAGEVFYRYFAERHLDALEPLPGAGDMLDAFDAAGVYLGVVSNKKGPYVRREATHLGWDRHFGAVVGALDAARDKPARDPVDMALAAGPADGEGAVWLVGDADIDLECAANAGCVPVLLRPAAPGPDEFTQHPPALHVPSCGELCKLVLNL